VKVFKEVEAMIAAGAHEREETRQREAKSFYREALENLNDTGHRFLIGGAFAFFRHTGIYRDTKDLDIFCTSHEYPDILAQLARQGYTTEVRDSRWLAKAYKDEHFIDIIFNSPNGICVVDESWFENPLRGELEGIPSLFLAAEELIWCKIYVQNRERFDGADVNHLILKKGKDLNWRKIINRLNPHWQLLLGQLFNFLFVYPACKDCVPDWVFQELLGRVKKEFDLPQGMEKICRGPLLTHTHYNPDIREWGYKNI
jgi:hypothetical protein